MYVLVPWYIAIGYVVAVLIGFIYILVSVLQETVQVRSVKH